MRMKKKRGKLMKRKTEKKIMKKKLMRKKMKGQEEEERPSCRDVFEVVLVLADVAERLK